MAHVLLHVSMQKRLYQPLQLYLMEGVTVSSAIGLHSTPLRGTAC